MIKTIQRTHIFSNIIISFLNNLNINILYKYENFIINYIQ